MTKSQYIAGKEDNARLTQLGQRSARPPVLLVYIQARKEILVEVMIKLCNDC